MTDLEISKALALAIGWPEHSIEAGCDATNLVYVCVAPATLTNFSTWKRFDYRDWSVIGPIAERYSAFPSSVSSGNFRKAKKQGYTDVAGWEVSMFDYKNGKEKSGKWHSTFASTPQKAIALAVIGAAT